MSCRWRRKCRVWHRRPRRRVERKVECWLEAKPRQLDPRSLSLSPVAMNPSSLTAAETHYPLNLFSNSQSIHYVKSSPSSPPPPPLDPPIPAHLSLRAATASISGATAGVLGLTNLAGFGFYVLSSLLVGVVFALANCRVRPGVYFAKRSDVVVGGLLDNAFSFVLFWTRESLVGKRGRERALTLCSPPHAVFYALVHSAWEGFWEEGIRGGC